MPVPQIAALPAFATGADLSAYTRGQVSPDDPTGLALLAAASTAIRNYCGWHIYPVIELVSVLDCEGGPQFSLPSKQVNDLTEVRDRSADTVIDGESYEWSRLGQVRMTSKKAPNCTPSSWQYWVAGWPIGYRVLEVSYSSGFESSPADLASVVLSMSARAASSPSGITREQAGQVSVNYATAVPGVSGGMGMLGPERDVLDAYRIVGA